MLKFTGRTLFILTAFIWLFTLAVSGDPADTPEDMLLFPGHNAVNVNPDTRLKLVFSGKPAPGRSGCIRIYDAADNNLADILDMAVPPGPAAPTPSPDAVYTPVPYDYTGGNFTNKNTKPGTPSGMALPTPDTYHLTIIGGFTDGFHFHPVITGENTAVIYLHNNILEYDKTYYVEIDPGVLTVDGRSFTGIKGKNRWRFSTKKAPPPLKKQEIVVSADGTGDFNTVQGAVDFIPDHGKSRVTVFIRKGIYEEIVYFRNKSNITFLGEDRDKVLICYENNEIFNPHPVNIKTNEVPGTFPSRRAVFAADNSEDIHIVNLSIKNSSYGQAEGLLLNGRRFIIKEVNITGSGDALQSNGTAFFSGCRITGDGDTILGRGPAFFKNCELASYGPYMWIRNTQANHGNVFVDCLFRTRGKGSTVIARSPVNGAKTYPYSEAVLINCRLSGIDPAGWGAIGGDVKNIRYWEYGSRNMDGTPADTAKRHPASRQLTMEHDAGLIAGYSSPVFVLDGWDPEADTDPALD